MGAKILLLVEIDLNNLVFNEKNSCKIRSISDNTRAVQ